MKEGRKAIEDVNTKLGLAFGDWDLNFYTNLFVNVLKRDPTTVELFDLAQSNSEHSRHWFFKGKMTVDNVPKDKSLIKMIIDTQKTTNQNNTLKFSDNSSAIRGFKHKILRPVNVTGPGLMHLADTESDLIFTAETHNMPTAVAPFSGATTGTGGMGIMDAAMRNKVDQLKGMLLAKKLEDLFTVLEWVAVLPVLLKFKEIIHLI